MPASHRDETIRLSSLGLTPTRGGDVAVTGLCLDSRKIKQGEVFAALAGSHAHGASYAQAVLAAGASAILTDPEGAKIIGDLAADQNASLIVVAEPRAALAQAAALWFGAQPDTMVAVTGTNDLEIIGDLAADQNASLIVVAEPRAALAQAAALWFGAQPDTMVAVTGTNDL